MRNRLLATAILFGLTIPAHAQVLSTGGGPIESGPIRDNASEQIDLALPRAVQRARELGLDVDRHVGRAIDRNAVGRLDWPLLLRPGSKRLSGNGLSNYVDLQPTSGLQDWNCGTRTYDGHRGIDYSIGVYPWRTMDAQEVSIVAAAPGTLVEKADGNFDRVCVWGGSPPANYVIIQQDDGLFAFYWHMKNGSVATAPVGARIAKGQYLGYVGSSGFSTGPHLHLELREASNATTSIDPYAGACGATPTLWKHQHKANDGRIARITTHNAQPPSASSSCDNPDPAYANRFAPGQQIWASVHLDDQAAGETALVEFVRPDGSVYTSFNTLSPSSGFYIHSYWWGSIIPSGPAGLWKIRATFKGRVHEHTFKIGPKPANTTLKARVQTQARSLVAGSSGKVDVYVTNTGSQQAVGCWVDPDWNMSAQVQFEVLSNAGAPLTSAGENFSILPGATRRVGVTITPESGTTANLIDVPIRVSCLNANGVAPFLDYNYTTLSWGSTGTPDIVASFAPAGTDLVELPGTSNIVTRVLTATNNGSAGTLFIKPYKTILSTAVSLAICEINGAGACLEPFAASITKTVNAGQFRRFKVRFRSTGAIPLDEFRRRVLVKFLDGNSTGPVRGQTSIAVKTP